MEPQRLTPSETGHLLAFSPSSAPMCVLDHLLRALWQQVNKRGTQVVNSCSACHGGETQREVTGAGGLEPWLISSTKNRILQRKDRTKESSFQRPRVAYCGKVNVRQRETNGGRFVCRFLWCSLEPGLVRVFLQYKNLYPVFRQRRGGQTELFLCLLLLNDLHLKIVFMPKRCRGSE